MRKSKKAVLLGLVLGLVFITPVKISAKETNTSKTYYLYNGDSAKYKDQPTLCVKESITDVNQYQLAVPVMKKVTKIVFSSNVKTVPDYFFQKYPNVKEVQISKNFKTTAALTDLSRNKKLSTIKVSASNKKYRVKDNVLYTYNMRNLVTYPNSKKDSSYKMPSTVKSAVQAFGKNPYLKKITLSKSFSSFDNSERMTALPKLEAITVTSGNKYFKAKNGVLYSHNMKTVLIYPNGKKNTTYTVPATVTSIDNCFGSNQYMKTLVIGKKVSNFSIRTALSEKELPNLTNIKVTAGNKYFANYKGALYTKGFQELIYCARGKVKPYKVNAATRKISYGAFDNCKIVGITLPEGLKQIEFYSFRNTRMKELTLPASLVDAGDVGELTEGMNSLEKITVKDGCENYYSKDDILYSIDGEIIGWPAKCQVKELSFTEPCLKVVDLTRFKNAQSVEKITLGQSVQKIKMHNNHLKEISLDGSNYNLKLFDGVLYNYNYTKIMLYPNQNPNTSVTLHDNLKVLDESWFDGSNNTEELTLPDELESIWTNYTSFEGNATAEPGEETEYVYLDDYDEAAFAKSPFQNLKKINISPDNEEFTCEDHVLYDKDMTELIWYPVNRENTEYVLPDTVVKLNGQLRECKNLKALTLNKDVKSTLDFIGVYSDSLESITIPEENDSYASVNGILYSKNMEKLIIYPNGKTNTSYAMPDTVVDARFTWSNTHLKTIRLSKNLKSITRYPLLLDTDTKANYIVSDIFSGFTQLEKVYGFKDRIQNIYML